MDILQNSESEMKLYQIELKKELKEETMYSRFHLTLELKRTLCSFKHGKEL